MTSELRPPPAVEAASVEPSVDPITLEVIRNKLDDIADEMEITLLKSSHSAIVKEALDASAAVFDAEGEQIAQATAAPIHLGMIIPAVKKFVELFPPQEMEEGDAYILNDPFEGGTHLPDLVVSVPVIVEGETLALATAITHHQEIGGRSPGSTPMDATEIFQEGLRIPPLKLYERGVANQTLLAMLAKNVRIPETVIGDLNGQLAACHTARRRLLELTGRYGKESLKGYLGELLGRAERLTREAISRIPDGRYHFVDYLDNDGIDLERRIRIEATVTVAGSELVVDLNGSDPQVAGPLNCVPASTLAAIYYVIKVVIDPEIPNNAGCYRPVKVILPEGSIVNARPPAAVNARAVVVRRIVDCLLGCFAQALPGRIPAASGGHPLMLSMGGIDPANGRPYVTAEIGTGGMGGRPGKDGLEAIQTDTSNAQNIPVEALELEFPIRVGHYRLRRDSGGPGQHRGGLGLEKSLEVLRGELRVSHRGERHYTAPWGLAGGGAGAMSRSTLVRADGSRQGIPSKLDFTMRPGDRLELWMTGGGGYGDALQREPERVLEDVRDGKLSQEAAAADYGVVVEEDRVDVVATGELRGRMRDQRGPISWMYDRGPLGRE
ncbi:hydantoinase B/oxoprolinase family protein [Candidatus Nephthysia bennettiae]|uniref:Hydantoinase B/oxoprolinase family protein n=1 Tax=Candidatus Nephthysia bennettiae TaxID=3127016 RepID=A0A934NBY6_9BACT|nr:hydantoinase B/oxoprolinase family protein [Candidatus Dormibacteraeota bacterium]